MNPCIDNFLTGDFKYMGSAITSCDPDASASPNITQKAKMRIAMRRDYYAACIAW
tara:strand:+ start:347 stop:511 length:165 start_codon:yes stop_codon:yes gene_type:complete